MPTPEDAFKAARDAVEALPSHLFDRAHTDEIAENLAPDLDRFAAQRGAEELERIATWLDRIGEHDHADSLKATLLNRYREGAPPQTGGGDAPVDMSMDAIRARLATYQPLGSKARGVAGLAIAPDEPFEQDGIPEEGVDFPATTAQTGGGDAKRACSSTAERGAHNADVAGSTPAGHTTSGDLLSELPRGGSAGPVGATIPRPPQTGDGDAGERDVTRQAIWAYYGYDVDVNDIDPDSAEAAAIERIDALLSSHREGAEAMREDAAQLLAQRKQQWDDDHNRGHQCSLTVQNELGASEAAVRAIPIPGKTDAG